MKYSSSNKVTSKSLPNSGNKKWLQNKNLKLELGNAYTAYTVKQKEFQQAPSSKRIYTFSKNKTSPFRYGCIR